MDNITELRKMNTEQLNLTLKEVSKELFELRCKSATEKVDYNLLRILRQQIARVKTLLNEQKRAEAPTT